MASLSTANRTAIVSDRHRSTHRHRSRQQMAKEFRQSGRPHDRNASSRAVAMPASPHPSHHRDHSPNSSATDFSDSSAFFSRPATFLNSETVLVADRVC
jgi:hypothetical protein